MGDLDDRLARYQAQVWDDVPAAFFERRGITHSTVARFGLGYTGQLGRGKALDVRRCLVLPYEDGLGRVRQLRYRPLYSGAKAKYLSTEKQSHLFAVRALDNPTVYVCEGEMDTMILWQLGYKAIGLPGATNWKDEWKWLFRAPHVEEAVLVLDPDEAGMSAARRLYSSLKEVIDVRTVSLPKGLDVNDTLLQLGEDTLKEALA